MRTIEKSIEISGEVGRRDFNHLYEHMFIEWVEREVQKLGYDIGLIGNIYGWTLSGDGPEGAVFLMMDVYDSAAEKDIEKLFNSRPVFREGDVNKALPRLGAELGVRIEITDMEALIVALNSFPAEAPKDSMRLVLDRGLRRYQVKARLMSEDVGLKKLFLQYGILLKYMLGLNAQMELGAYRSGGTAVLYNLRHKCLEFTVRFTAPEGMAKKIGQSIEEKIKSLNIKESYSLISEYMRAFRSGSAWRKETVEFFKNTAILTTRDEIADLATIENIKKIHENLKVTVE